MIGADRVPGHTRALAIVAVEIWRRNVQAATGAKPRADLAENRHRIKKMLDDLDEGDSIKVRETLQSIEARHPKIQSERGLTTGDKYGRDLDADRTPPVPLEGIDQEPHSTAAIYDLPISSKAPDTIQDRPEEAMVTERKENELSPNPGEGTAGLVLRERTVFQVVAGE